jgi:hypothetical protein
MTPRPVEKDKVISALKEWLTPTLISIVGVMLWTELTELRADVKTLLMKTSATEAKLAMLEKEVDYLRNNSNVQRNEPTIRFPYERATPKKEDGPKVPSPEGSDKERI